MTNKDKKIIPCLFDYKDFFYKKGHLYFPGTLCFPQFFALSIHAIFSNIIANNNENEYEDILCNHFFNMLQVIVNQIYINYKINVSVEKINHVLEKTKQTKSTDDNYILLESYLKDDDSCQNYRKALRDSVLHYHECSSIEQLSEILFQNGCCLTKGDCNNDNHYPSSEHYIVYGLQNNNSTITSDIVFNTGFWGPFYWNIFHSIAEKCDTVCLQKKLINFIYTFPFTLPCSQCKYNYIEKMDIFEIFLNHFKENNNDDAIFIQHLYSKIHDVISKDTKN